MSVPAERRARRRTAAAVLRTRRTENRAHRDATERVKVSEFLAGVGMPVDDIDRYGSWAGRHIVSKYRAAHDGHEPRKTRKRTKPCKGYPKGRWIKVNVYRLTDPALIAGASTYKRTASFVAAAYDTAA
ncbi:hypothetical protein ACFYZ9_33675 [Streptomyces sp. NPDC001691]|uniref:hypothetical protein n=1 Tax=Streptomyces sp. NPDC001691 TaxID=3364600 RepID=UPI0036829648